MDDKDRRRRLTTDPDRFGRFMAQIREAHGWTQREAAIRCNVDSSYLSRLEGGGVKNPNVLTLAKLANGYEVPLFYVLSGIIPHDDAPVDYVIGRALMHPAELRRTAAKIAAAPKLVTEIIESAGLRLADPDDDGPDGPSNPGPQ